VDGTRRLPISPLIDAYLVPEAPQGARSDPIPPLATSSAIGHIDHEKKVDLGVLRGADHDRRVPVSPFSTVDGFVSSSR
jgi:hypothetical protein